MIWSVIQEACSEAVRSAISSAIGATEGSSFVRAALDWYPALGRFASRRGPTPTFSRASGATMVDVAGNVVWGPENLLLESEDLTESAWAYSAVSILGGQVGPTGVTDAFLITPSSADSNLQQTVSAIKSSAVTYSVWLKSNTGANITTKIYLYDGVNDFNPDIVVTPVWQRFQLNVTTSASATTLLAIIGGYASLSIGENILMWHPQLERHATARAYIPTTSSPVFGPRITYDPITHECLGYLAEEQRANLLKWSDSFSAVDWVPAAANVFSNVALSPSGAMDADKIVEDVNNSEHLLYQGVIGVGGVLCFSCYLKAGERTWAQVVLQVADDCGVNVNLATGVLGSSFGPLLGSFIQDAGGGWYRVTVVADRMGISDAFPFIATCLADSPTSRPAYLGDGASGIYAWGAQCEQGPVPTSLIPTTTAPVTRSADLAAITGADFAGFYNQDEGTWAVESIASYVAAPYIMAFAVDDGTPGANDTFNSMGSAGLRVRASVEFEIPSPPYIAGEAAKLAVAYKAFDYASSNSVNGLLTTSGTATVTTDQTTLQIGQYAGGGLILNGTISRIRFYRTRLPDETLTALTAPPRVSFINLPAAPTFFRRTPASLHGEDVTSIGWSNNTATANLVFDGDSITAAEYSSPYPAQVWRDLAINGTTANFANFAVAGQKLTDMIADGVTQIDARLQAGKKNILFVFAGTNDLAFESITPTEAHTRLATYCTARQTAGWTVVVADMIRRLPTDVGYDESDAFNVLVAANYSTYADVHCAWGADPAFSDVTNTLYYVDQIHPTQLGHDVLSSYAIPAVNTAIQLTA